MLMNNLSSAICRKYYVSTVPSLYESFCYFLTTVVSTYYMAISELNFFFATVGLLLLFLLHISLLTSHRFHLQFSWSFLVI